MPENPTILAIALKSDRVGLAVFDEASLIYYKITTLGRPRRHRSEVLSVKLRNICNAFKPEYIAIEKLVYKQQKTSVLVKLSEIALEFAIQTDHFYCVCSPLDVRSHLCKKSKPTKQRVITNLAKYYPELKNLSRNRTEEQIRYLMPLFNAIALGFYVSQTAFSHHRKAGR